MQYLMYEKGIHKLLQSKTSEFCIDKSYNLKFLKFLLPSLIIFINLQME